MSQVFAVRVRSFEITPNDSFVWVDAPDEKSAILAANKVAATKLPRNHLLRRIMSATPMGNDCPPDMVDAIVDYNGEEIELEILN